MSSCQLPRRGGAAGSAPTPEAAGRRPRGRPTGAPGPSGSVRRTAVLAAVRRAGDSRRPSGGRSSARSPHALGATRPGSGYRRHRRHRGLPPRPGRAHQRDVADGNRALDHARRRPATSPPGWRCRSSARYRRPRRSGRRPERSDPLGRPYYVRARARGPAGPGRNPNYRGPRPRRPGPIVYRPAVPPEGRRPRSTAAAGVLPWTSTRRSGGRPAARSRAPTAAQRSALQRGARGPA